MREDVGRRYGLLSERRQAVPANDTDTKRSSLGLMKTEDQRTIDRLAAWEETKLTGRPALCLKHADGIIRELRLRCKRMFPDSLAMYDAGKTHNG